MTKRTKLTGNRKERAINDLKIYFGLPPHDEAFNICRSDGYFAQSLTNKYHMSFEELMIATSFKEILNRWEAHRNTFIKG